LTRIWGRILPGILLLIVIVKQHCATFRAAADLRWQDRWADTQISSHYEDNI